MTIIKPWHRKDVKPAPDLLSIAGQVVEAARKIRHWHDAMLNKETGETEGMIVSAESVRGLWAALAAWDAAMKGRK